MKFEFWRFMLIFYDDFRAFSLSIGLPNFFLKSLAKVHYLFQFTGGYFILVAT